MLYIGLLGQQDGSVDSGAHHRPLRPELFDWDPH